MLEKVVRSRIVEHMTLFTESHDAEQFVREGEFSLSQKNGMHLVSRYQVFLNVLDEITEQARQRYARNEQPFPIVSHIDIQ